MKPLPSLSFRGLSVKIIYLSQSFDILDVNTSPLLEGSSLEKAWKGVLAGPDKYRIIDSSDLLAPVITLPETRSVLTYLKGR